MPLSTITNNYLPLHDLKSFWIDRACAIYTTDSGTAHEAQNDQEKDLIGGACTFIYENFLFIFQNLANEKVQWYSLHISSLKEFIVNKSDSKNLWAEN